MKKIKLLLVLVIVLALIPSVLASSFNVSVTQSNELAFSIQSDDLGWHTSSVEIFNQKGKLVYDFEERRYFSSEPSFEIIPCPKCSSGNYSVDLYIDETKLSSSFFIQKNPFDWFWIIAILLVIGLAILAYFTLTHKSLKKHKVKSSKLIKSKRK